MEWLFTNLERSKSAEDAYHEFVSEASAVKSNNPYDIATVDRRFRAFIIEWRMCFDHWKNYIDMLPKDYYGADFVENLQKTQKTLMDKLYRNEDFLVSLEVRNYVTHVHTAIGRIHIDKQDSSYFIKKSKVLDNLRKKYANNTEQKKRLQQRIDAVEHQPDEILLTDIANKALNQLKEFHESLMDILITNKQIVYACGVLLDAKDRIDKAKIESDDWICYKIVSADIEVQAVHDPVNKTEGEPFHPCDPLQMEASIMQHVSHIILNWSAYRAVAGMYVSLLKKGQLADVDNQA